MRLARQPTIKTLLLLTAVYAVMLGAARSDFGSFDEAARLDSTRFDRGTASSIVLTSCLLYWSLPLLAALIVSRRLTVALCVVVGVAYQAIIWWVGLSEGACVDVLSGLGDDTIFLVGFVVGGPGELQFWAQSKFNNYAEPKIWLEGVCSALWLLLYVTTGFLFAMTMRLREHAPPPASA